MFLGLCVSRSGESRDCPCKGGELMGLIRERNACEYCNSFCAICKLSCCVGSVVYLSGHVPSSCVSLCLTLFSIYILFVCQHVVNILFSHLALFATMLCTKKTVSHNVHFLIIQCPLSLPSRNISGTALIFNGKQCKSG
ncbi:unnamed protein product [Choristocarpus tenellus]